MHPTSDGSGDGLQHQPQSLQGVISSPMDLLARMGGPAALRAVTDQLYDRLLADDEIGPIFSQTHMPTMRQRLSDYLIGACVGEVTVSARRLRSAHSEHDVNDRHFSIMASNLADILSESDIDPDTSADFLDLIADHRGDIVSQSHVVAEWDPYDDTI